MQFWAVAMRGVARSSPGSVVSGFTHDAIRQVLEKARCCQREVLSEVAVLTLEEIFPLSCSDCHIRFLSQSLMFSHSLSLRYTLTHVMHNVKHAKTELMVKKKLKQQRFQRHGLTSMKK